jgi:hypothetical protein
MHTALAFYNETWKAMCPEPGCLDARSVYHPGTGERMTQDVCAAGHPFEIVMPDAEFEAQVVTVLAGRAVAADRSWYPHGHTWATLNGFPTGQSVGDLARENDEVTRFRATQDESRKTQLAGMLAELGIKVRDDGSFEGQI